MLSYNHFTLDERKYLQELLSQGYSIRKIAAFWAEAPRLSAERFGGIVPVSNQRTSQTIVTGTTIGRAQILYTVRRKECGKSRRTLKPGTFVYWYVVEGLKRFWSPEQIAHRLPIDYPGLSISTSTIYRHLKAVICKKSAEKRICGGRISKSG